MGSNGLGKYTVSFGLSLAITCIFSALLVIVKELSPSILEGMKRATSHHWITHGVLDLILFFVLGFLLARMNGGSGVAVSAKNLVTAIVSCVAIGGLIIAGFYLFVG